MKQTITGSGHELQAWFEPAGPGARTLWVAGTHGLSLQAVIQALQGIGWLKQNGTQQELFDAYPLGPLSFTRRKARCAGAIVQGKVFAAISRTMVRELMPCMQ